MEKLNSQILNCQKCPLAKTRIKPVFGEWNPQADILFIGEAPGKNEDEQGVPFIGRAGKVLDEMLAEIDLKRSDIFITNVVKCRPPQNRDPLASEKKICWTYLEEQIKIIEPKIIVLLGRHAMMDFFPSDYQISKVHGQAFRKKDGIVYFPIYHPAAVLYNPAQKDILKSDFLRLQKILQKLEG